MEIINVIDLDRDGIINRIDSFIIEDDQLRSDVVDDAEETAIFTAVRKSLGEDEYNRMSNDEPDELEELLEYRRDELEDGYLDCGDDGTVQIVWSYI